MKGRLLVLQHGEYQSPGRFLCSLAEELSIDVYLSKSWKESFADSGAFDALVVTGCPPDCSNRGLDNSSEAEKRFLRSWLERDKPLLGFGSAHQLLAEIFHASVEQNIMTGEGFVKGYLTHNGKDHPLFKDITPNISLFKWYNKSMVTPIPQNCLMLATSCECVVEAFSVKGRPHIIGMQCDNHAAHPDDIRRWMTHLPPERISGRVLLEQAEQSLERNRKVFHKLIRNFMELTHG